MLLSLCWAVLATISSLILAEQSRIDGVYPGEEIEMDFSEKLDQELDFVLPFLSSKWPSNATIKPLGYVTWPLKNNQKCFENNSTARDLLKPRDVITFVDGTYHDRNTFHYTAAFYYWSDNYNVVLRSKLSALQPGTDISSSGFVSEEEVIFDSSDPTSSDVTFYQLVATLASYETDFLEEVVFYYNHTSEQVMLQVLAEDEREPVREGVKDQFFWKGFP